MHNTLMIFHKMFISRTYSVLDLGLISFASLGHRASTNVGSHVIFFSESWIV